MIMIQSFLIPHIRQEPIVRTVTDAKTSIYVNIKILIKMFRDNKNTLLLSSNENCSLYSSDVRLVLTSWLLLSKLLIVLISNKNDK